MLICLTVFADASFDHRSGIAASAGWFRADGRVHKISKVIGWCNLLFCGYSNPSLVSERVPAFGAIKHTRHLNNPLPLLTRQIALTLVFECVPSREGKAESWCITGIAVLLRTRSRSISYSLHLVALSFYLNLVVVFSGSLPLSWLPSGGRHWHGTCARAQNAVSFPRPSVSSLGACCRHTRNTDPCL